MKKFLCNLKFKKLLISMLLIIIGFQVLIPNFVSAWVVEDEKSYADWLYTLTPSKVDYSLIEEKTKDYIVKKLSISDERAENILKNDEFKNKIIIKAAKNEEATRNVRDRL